MTTPRIAHPALRSEPECRRACESTSTLGYRIIEIPLLDPASVDAAMTKRVLSEFNLRGATSLGLTFDADVSSPDNDCAARGEAAGATSHPPYPMHRMNTKGPHAAPNHDFPSVDHKTESGMRREDVWGGGMGGKLSL